jgi:hypothetical protein
MTMTQSMDNSAEEKLPFASNLDDAKSDRAIYDPQRDGLEYDPMKINWSPKNYQLPTGDKLGIFKVANTSLFRIGFVEKTASARVIPDKFSGMYTSASAAQGDLETYLMKAWKDAEKRSAGAGRRTQGEQPVEGNA